MRSRAQPVVGLGVAVVAVLSSLLAASAAGADRIGALHREGVALAANTHATLVDLYVLDSKLDRARTELATVGTRIVALEHQRREARLELRAARVTLGLAQHHLGGQLRVLYEHDQPDVLALILGASSLDELITGLDSLSRTAGATHLVIAHARTARARVTRVARALSERHEALVRLRAAAGARTRELEAALAARETYLATLRGERRLNAAQIASAELQAGAARARSRTATLAAEVAGSVTSLAAQPLASPVGDPPPRAGSGRTLTVLATAYSLPGSTASGLPVGPGIVAVDPTVIPLGTRMTIPGYGEGVAADVGTAIKGLRIDVWFPKLAQAQAWGLRRVTITLH